MADTIQELIIQNVKTALETVTDLKLVQRDVLNPLDMDSFPAAVLIDLGATPEGVPTLVTRLELSILIESWVMLHVGSATALENLNGEIDKAILLDPRRGGRAQNTTFAGKESVFAVAREALRGTQLRYTIQFRHKTGDPFTII